MKVIAEIMDAGSITAESIKEKIWEPVCEKQTGSLQLI